MEEITVEQKGQLKTWAGQRDVLLSEISILRNEKLNLEKTNSLLSNSSSELEERVISTKAKMQELDKQESEYNLIVSSEIHESLISKTRLQGEVAALEKQVSLLNSKKDLILESIRALEKVNDKAFRQANSLDKIVDHVVKVSMDNENKIESLVSNLQLSCKTLIDINAKNVEATNIVIEKLPRMIVELQKHGLIKKI